MSEKMYSWKCKKCKRTVESPVSGYPDDLLGEHLHCPTPGCDNIMSLRRRK